MAFVCHTSHPGRPHCWDGHPAMVLKSSGREILPVGEVTYEAWGQDRLPAEEVYWSLHIGDPGAGCTVRIEVRGDISLIVEPD
jgi:hypothetical protein